MPEETWQLDPVVGIARDAGDLLLSHFHSNALRTSEKGFLDVVTQADTESEALIVGRLAESFPDDAVVGEEGTNTPSGNGRIWYVDPLDGTFNFSHGIPFWCISIGLVVKGEPALAVLYDPIRDEMFTTLSGERACLNGSPIVASKVTDPMKATLQLTVNYDRQVIDESIHDFNVVARNVMRLRNLGALALELAYVACGRLDAVAQRGSHPWDYSAGVLLCHQAGATVTDLDGSQFRLDTDDALAAGTPKLHAALCAMLAPIA